MPGPAPTDLPSASCRRGCGRCCDPVILNPRISRTVVEALAFQPDRVEGDLAFIRDHWTRRDIDDPGRMPGHTDGTTYWDCDRYDPITGECLAHDGQPVVCSGFPWYGEKPHHNIWLDMACTYHADLGRTVLPLTVAGGGR